MITCDKCRSEAIAAVTCEDCNRIYRRCHTCGGEAGAERSLHSHRAVYHPKKGAK